MVTCLMFALSFFYCTKWEVPNDFVELSKVNLTPIWDFYALNIRGNLFAGLISVGGFLMAGKTFILVTMKQNVFDDKSYRENFQKMVKLDPSLKVYGPLSELKNILYYSVLMTIISSVVQMTIGLIPHWSMAIISIFFATFSIILVIDSLNLIKRNLDFWIDS